MDLEEKVLEGAVADFERSTTLCMCFAVWLTRDNSTIVGHFLAENCLKKVRLT